ncbi:MAG: cell division protein FtsA, partial [Anaerolineae bacterium]|nr:cell division protein FtsA [Anaerolineae bacterium]
MNELICALDVGTTKICALIARLDENNVPRVIGVGRVPARGLRRGMVVNTTDATAAIGQAIEQAEASAGGITMESAYVGITGAHIAVLNSKGATAVGRSGRRITQEDCQRALDQARTMAMPHNREIINVVARSYSVDDEAGIQNPVGMFGYRLEVDASVITGATSAIANLTNCVQAHGLDIDDLVLEPLASGEAVLTPAERQAGVAVVDIGGGTTDVAVFRQGRLAHSAVIPLGGDHVSQDIAKLLQIPVEEAERVAKKYGAALPEL